jgi:hypothetical protein
MRRIFWRTAQATAATVLVILLTGCPGGGGGGSFASSGFGPPAPVNNVQPVTVGAGTSAQPNLYDNALYTTVTICVPGTSTCQNIDNVLVDTGTTGVRILSSALTLNLPATTDANNNPIGNCIQYADSTYQWGPVAVADVRMAGEVASSVPMQIVGPSNFAAAPAACSAGGAPAQTAIELGANGVLGVGNYRQDCGVACASASAPPVYFSCPGNGCTATEVAVSAQLQNPVWMFLEDNNGLAIVLPQLGAGGGTSISGSMIFGIGTQSNNALGSAQAQALNADGFITTTFNGTAYARSFIDSGSNGYFFLDSASSGLPYCAGTSVAVGFYCPNSAVNFTAMNSGLNPNGSGATVSANVGFSIANALTLLSSPETAFNNLGGSYPGAFDWGLPFFFGRTVFIGIEGQNTGSAVGPFWAY